MRDWLFCAVIIVMASGCGSPGSPARFHPEARFQVEPLGGQMGTSFEVESIASGDSEHHFQTGRIFTATEPVGFFLDNARPPYGAKFRWLEGAEADVALIVSGRTVQVSPVRLGPDNPEVELRSRASQGDILARETHRPEVRLEVFADPGTLFQGTVGDFFRSYDIGFTFDDDERSEARAPAFIFFERPKETISAVVRNANQLEITLNLYINGDLIQSETSKGDAIVQKDL